MAVKNYRDLIVWQKAMDLVAAVYLLAQEMPRSELFGLTAQMKRAVISVPVNIAEGEGRASQREFKRFLRISYGSLREVETQVLIAIRLGYATEKNSRSVMEIATEVGRLVNGLQRSLVERQ